MDKGIIVNVSKCEHFGIRTSNGKRFGWCHYYDDHCKDYLNCYFKQLAETKAEIKKLKEYKQLLEEIKSLLVTEYANKYFQYEKLYDQIMEIINKAKEK